ncbi:hypothetical protein FPANT_11201 [Fusarium pseudoanthophilum]|uniref:Uncharacterized protein n=1 Tax=Fusarium pseudoanthophilum TaxID=48495 RepID=A0A8H5KKX8_9HYPO|nr:hypothetical protein FPANT_11201 [Fusarium pseudoanthophilum]
MSDEQVANRAANATIFGAGEFSEQEKYSFHDLLHEWCNARPLSGTNAQAITDVMQESFFEKVSFAWDSDDSMIMMPVLSAKKLRETSVAAGYFITNLPVTPSKLYVSVKFEPNSQRKDFETCWKDEGGLTVSSELVRFKDGVTKAKAIVNLDKSLTWGKYDEEEVIDRATRLTRDKQKPPKDLSHFMPNGQIPINTANVQRFNEKYRLEVEDLTTAFLRSVPDVVKSVLGADNFSPTDLLYLPLVGSSFKLWGVYIEIAMRVDTDEVTGIFAYKTYIGSYERVQHHERQPRREYDSIPKYKRSRHYQAICQDDVEPDCRLISLFEVTTGN